MPSAFLNSRLKYEMSLKPESVATSAIDASRLRISSLAYFILMFRISQEFRIIIDNVGKFKYN